LPAWAKLVADGKKTASDLFAMLSTKATFSEEQKASILSLKIHPPVDVPPDQPAAPAETADATDTWVADYDAAGGAK